VSTASGPLSRTALAYVLLFLVGAFGLTWNLGDRLLWGDEAETAVLAVNVTRYGLPRSDDGRNVVTLTGADSNESGVWVWSPWLDEYVAAGAFALLGESTWAARAPFALAGLATVVLLAAWTWHATRPHETALAVTALLVTCVPFLLLARQCRYYAVVMLAQVWLLWGIRAALRPGLTGRAGALHMAGALAVQFHCNYVPALGSALGVVAASFALRLSHPRLPLTVAAALAGLGALALPWLVYSGGYSQAQWLGAAPVLPNLLYFATHIDRHVFPLVLLAIPALARALPGVFRGARIGEPAASPAPGLEVAVCWMVGAHLTVIALSPLRYFRYLGPLIPLLLFLLALLLVRCVRPRWLRWSLVATVALTSALHGGADWVRGRASAELPYLRFARSITTAYEDRLEDVVDFLRREARPGEALYVADPELPLVFYTELRVVDARLRPPPEGGADWILASPASGVVDARLVPPPERLADYERIPLPVRASLRGGSRPNPDEHAWFTATDTEELVLYRRRPP
jgi:hypothetical protein